MLPSAFLLTPKISNGFNRTIGISAAPSKFAFISDDQVGLVTPAEEHTTTAGPPGIMPLFEIISFPIMSNAATSRNFVGVIFNVKRPITLSNHDIVSLKPVAAQTTASQSLQFTFKSFIFLISHWTISSLDDEGGSTSAAFFTSRTSARTTTVLFGRLRSSWTTNLPTRPVEPVTKIFPVETGRGAQLCEYVKNKN